MLSVGIGLGLQGATQNFISGLALLIERPLQKGDFVVVGDTVGRVESIKMRATRILTRDDQEALALIRHDAAHVMAEAVQELYPGTQVTIGPVIDNGFYYDFARDEPFVPGGFYAGANYAVEQAAITWGASGASRARGGRPKPPPKNHNQGGFKHSGRTESNFTPTSPPRPQ